MSAKLEKIENSEAYLHIEVEAEVFEKGLQKAYKKVVKQVAIPGFRKGRVPRELLEAHFGKEILFEDALEYVVPDAYEKALEELNIDPIAQPEFDFEEIQDDNILKFNAKVAVKPDVKLGQLEGLEVNIPVFELKEEDVDARLEEMSARYAQLIEKVDEAADNGDTVNIDFEGFVDGEAFPGGTAENYQLVLGSGTFIPGFEEQIVGLKKGDSTDVKVDFPQDYHAAELAGQAAVFKVTVNKVESKQLRALDDEFAQEVSQFETIAELREDTRKNLQQMLETQKNNFLKEAVLDKALEGCEIEVPPAAVKMQINHMLTQFSDRLRMQGLSLEQYFQFTGRTLEEFNAEAEPEAEKTARSNFMLEKIMEEKGISVSEEEVEKHIAEIAESMGIEPEQAKQNLSGVMDEIEFGLKMDKAIQYLVDHAVVTEADIPEEDLVAEGETEA
ncbi:Trigger factor [Syntrophomonas zehnderi OL-4]|uniref:Trigger factor n=1 Tax=Syntrophomonas zehnderi OL-4 TaxID=690567 RepID=A0A0E3W3G9_9FIRM|nr:trigger factor [Syntrophomonas zehnderi]CFX81965.1 Trigger factor [Syntrophomonas zehnderi OL-4]